MRGVIQIERERHTDSHHNPRACAQDGGWRGEGKTDLLLELVVLGHLPLVQRHALGPQLPSPS